MRCKSGSSLLDPAFGILRDQALGRNLKLQGRIPCLADREGHCSAPSTPLVDKHEGSGGYSHGTDEFRAMIKATPYSTHDIYEDLEPNFNLLARGRKILFGK